MLDDTVYNQCTRLFLFVYNNFSILLLAVIFEPSLYIIIFKIILYMLYIIIRRIIIYDFH